MSADTAKPAKPPRRTHAEAREAAISQIIDIATAEFVEKGLAGARIDEIAGKATKRKIYYYFEGKDELYRAVLERAYRAVRESESQVDIDSGTALEALRRLIEHDVHYHAQHPELVRLVMNENIHRGEFLGQSKMIQTLNVPAINAVRQVYERGVKAGVFRSGIDPVDLHMSISALSFFNVSNHHTFSLIFKRDLSSPAAIVARRDSIIEMVVRFVRK